MKYIKLYILGILTMFGSCFADCIQEKEQTVTKLELLLEHTKGLQFPEIVSRGIIKSIESELDYAKDQLIKELGKRAYQERKKK